MNIGQSVNLKNQDNLMPFSRQVPTEKFFTSSQKIHPDKVMDLVLLGKSNTGFVQCAATFEDLNTHLVWIPENCIQS